MVARTRDARKRAFTKALVDAGMTRQQFAAEQGVTYTHLYLVETGKRESRKLSAAIDAFIAEHGAAEVQAA